MMKFLRSEIKKRLYTSCPGFAGSFPYYGAKVYFPKGSIIFSMVCEQRIYEQVNLALIKTLVKPNSFYFDVGANIGLLSVPILSHYSSSQVVSFEPSPFVLPFLKRTVECSPYRDRWIVVEKATGHKAGFTEFYTSNSGSEAYSGFQDTNRADTHIKIDVPVTTLDIEWEMLGKPMLSVIKIDVEGAELQVIAGATECIKHEKPYILVEWNSTNLEAYCCTADQLLKTADDIGYRVFGIFEDCSNYYPFNILSTLDFAELTLQMLLTETFLLVPKSA